MPDSIALKPLLTYPEAARFLRVSRSTLCRWVQARRIPHLRVGTQVRFDPEVLKKCFRVAEADPGALQSPPIGEKGN